MARCPELMAGGFDWQEFGASGDQLQRRFHFLDGAKIVARAVNEKRWGVQLGKMPSAKLLC